MLTLSHLSMDELQDMCRALGVRPKFHLLGMVTVCSLLDGLYPLVEARGLSVCSPNEIFVPAEGRRIALYRALMALLYRENLEPIIPRKFRVVREGKIWGYSHLDKVCTQLGRIGETFGILYKAEYRPVELLDCGVKTLQKTERGTTQVRTVRWVILWI